MHVLRKSTHVDRYLDDTIFDPQGVAVAPPLLLQTEKYACMHVPWALHNSGYPRGL